MFANLIATTLASAASLYFAKSDDKKQEAMETMVMGHTALTEQINAKLDDLTATQLSDQFNYWNMVDTDLEELLDRASEKTEEFSTMNKAELITAEVVLKGQRLQVRQHITKILNELKSRYV